MSHRAYGAMHQRIRAMLMERLRQTAPWPCPICGEPMWPTVTDARRSGLDLHHSDPRRKAAGLPGDCLAHSRCNRGQQSREKARLKIAAKLADRPELALRGTVAPPATGGRVKAAGERSDNPRWTPWAMIIPSGIRAVAAGRQGKDSP
jgi:hypothetical protein